MVQKVVIINTRDLTRGVKKTYNPNSTNGGVWFLTFVAWRHRVFYTSACTGGRSAQSRGCASTANAMIDIPGEKVEE